ncbi:MAG: GPW/gp25 family protein [Pontiella sp.]
MSTNHDFLGTGLKFPFSFNTRSAAVDISTSTVGEHEHIRESIIQILGTRPGERFMNPEFGSKLKDLVFEQNDSVLKGLIRHHVNDAIRRWKKRIIVTDVSFDDSIQNTDNHLLPVIISYRVIRTQEEGNLVYPFIREGMEI